MLLKAILLLCGRGAGEIALHVVAVVAGPPGGGLDGQVVTAVLHQLQTVDSKQSAELEFEVANKYESS